MSDIDEKEVVEQVYAYAIELKKSGESDFQVEKALVEKGLDEESAKAIVSNVNNASSGSSESSGWLIWIAILIGINVLSAIFDWPFWIY